MSAGQQTSSGESNIEIALFPIHSLARDKKIRSEIKLNDVKVPMSLFFILLVGLW